MQPAKPPTSIKPNVGFYSEVSRARDCGKPTSNNPSTKVQPASSTSSPLPDPPCGSHAPSRQVAHDTTFASAAEPHSDLEPPPERRASHYSSGEMSASSSEEDDRLPNQRGQSSHRNPLPLIHNHPVGGTRHPESHQSPTRLQSHAEPSHNEDPGRHFRRDDGDLRREHRCNTNGSAHGSRHMHAARAWTARGGTELNMRPTEAVQGRARRSREGRNRTGESMEPGGRNACETGATGLVRARHREYEAEQRRTHDIGSDLRDRNTPGTHHQARNMQFREGESGTHRCDGPPERDIRSRGEPRNLRREDCDGSGDGRRLNRSGMVGLQRREGERERVKTRKDESHDVGHGAGGMRFAHGHRDWPAEPSSRRMQQGTTLEGERGGGVPCNRDGEQAPGLKYGRERSQDAARAGHAARSGEWGRGRQPDQGKLQSRDNHYRDQGNVEHGGREFRSHKLRRNTSFRGPSLPYNRDEVWTKSGGGSGARRSPMEQHSCHSSLERGLTARVRYHESGSSAWSPSSPGPMAKNRCVSTSLPSFFFPQRCQLSPLLSLSYWKLMLFH
jgi:hypothetical protein